MPRLLGKALFLIDVLMSEGKEAVVRQINRKTRRLLENL